MNVSDAARIDGWFPALGAIFGRYPQIATVYLFGSFARGSAGPDSDVDLGLVFRQRGARASDHYLMIGDLISRLEGVTHPHPVDLVVLESQGPVFCHRVLLEATKVYQADTDRTVDFESGTVVRALDFWPSYRIATEGRVEGLLRRLGKGES